MALGVFDGSHPLRCCEQHACCPDEFDARIVVDRALRLERPGRAGRQIISPA